MVKTRSRLVKDTKLTTIVRVPATKAGVIVETKVEAKKEEHLYLENEL